VLDGRYEVHTRLASGGMATVYLARQKATGQDVVVKLLHVEDDRTAARFAREARATARIVHENVVALLDFGLTEDRLFYLATEYVPGNTLDVVVGRSGPLAMDHVLHVATQIAAGVGHAHAQGIVHRDLKASNVMLAATHPETQVKVLDFGLARALSPDTDLPALTPPGDILGTPLYMAPEQWRGAPPDLRSDLYSLGVLMYLMRTGELPFTGSVGELMMAHLEKTAELPAPNSEPQAAAEELDAAVLRCLAKSPDDRFQSMGQLRDVLLGVQQRVTVAEAPSSTLVDVGHATTHIGPEWDHSGLVERLRRLHREREAAYARLCEALWGPDGRPEHVRQLEQQARDHEQDIEAVCGELEALHAEARSEAEALEQRQAQARGRMVDAGVALGALQVPELSAEVSAVRETQQNDPTEARDTAEREMAQTREQRTQQIELWGEQGAERLARLKRAESQLRTLYEQLAHVLHHQAAGRDQVRSLLVDFGRIDGALASYQGMLQSADPERR
jgi:hypothetical protein